MQGSAVQKRGQSGGGEMLWTLFSYVDVDMTKDAWSRDKVMLWRARAESKSSVLILLFICCLWHCESSDPPVHPLITRTALHWFELGLHDILHAIVMRISSVKTVLWLVVNLHHLFSNGAAFNTQSRSSLTSYAIRAQNRRWIACDSERDIA